MKKNLFSKIADGIVKFRGVILAVFIGLVVISLILLPKVKSNFDITSYLPKDMETRQALTVIEDEFGLNSSVNVMVKGIEKNDATRLAKKLKVKRVSMVTFDASSRAHYIQDEKVAFIKLMVDGGDYDDATQKVVREVRGIVQDEGYSFYMNGSGVSGTQLQTGIGGQMTVILLVSLSIVLVILLLTSLSWFEPLLFLVVVGVSILLNLGTNIIFGEISYITKSIAAILQLALAMDYSIVLLHAYHKHSALLPPKQAAAMALKESFKPIVSSSLTTIAGLMALVFMSFTIGRDIGLVMSKGIVFSMLTVFLLMPGLIVLFNKPLLKLKHKPLNLGGEILAKGVIKSRKVAPIIMLAVILAATVMSNMNTYSFTESQSTENEMITSYFPSTQSMILLVPKAQGQEDYLKQERTIEDIKLLKKNGQPAFVSASTYQSSLLSAGGDQAPDIVKEKLDVTFNGTNYSRIIVSFNLGKTDESTYAFIDELKEVLNKHFGSNQLIAGDVMSNYDISRSFTGDLIVTNVITILAILLIIGLTFRALLLPVVLVTIIQGAIFIGMCFSFIFGQPIFFMSYIIASAILMGATIDYAILVSNHYFKARQSMNREDAVAYALKNALPTILTSGCILVVAGFVVGIVSGTGAVGTIGMLLGRGALASIVLILVLLPQLLYLLDKPLLKTMVGGKKNAFICLTDKKKNDIV